MDRQLGETNSGHLIHHISNSASDSGHARDEMTEVYHEDCELAVLHSGSCPCTTRFQLYHDHGIALEGV